MNLNHSQDSAAIPKAFQLNLAFTGFPQYPSFIKGYIYSSKLALISIYFYFEARLPSIHFFTFTFQSFPFLFICFLWHPPLLPFCHPCNVAPTWYLTIDLSNVLFFTISHPSHASSFDFQKLCECSTCLIDNYITLRTMKCHFHLREQHRETQMVVTIWT